MLFSDILRLCWQNLRRRKARTMLTVLGVVIGCCAIVIMVSIGVGMSRSQEQMLAEMGDLTIITVMSSASGGMGMGPAGGGKLDDTAIAQMRELPNVVAVSPKQELGDFSVKLYAGLDRRYMSEYSTVVGMAGDDLEQLGFELTAGDYARFDPNRIQALGGQYLAYSFYDQLRPEGSNMIDRYEGMYDDEGNYNPDAPVPDPYFDPLTTPLTLEVVLDENGGALSFPITVTGTVKEDYVKGWETSDGLILDLQDMQRIVKEAKTALAQAATAKNIYSTALVKVNDISNVAEAESSIKALGFSTSSMESIRKPMEESARQVQLMLGGLGAISLFVAALGITNTMFMSISERTREIGVMKALGCFVKDIRTLFLLEAGSIGLLGGLIGCGVSLVASFILNMASASGSLATESLAMIAGEGGSKLSVIPPWLLLFAIAFSVAIGLISGFYPANRAVKISALEAIRGGE